MKAVILAGGKGTRISEESKMRPKPMVEIGGYPILWHIMNCYAKYDITEFIVCCGYKGHMIKEYFVNYNLHNNNICIDLKKENVHLEEQYFDVIDSKTENGIRKVPIADKLLPYYKDWYNSCPD